MKHRSINYRNNPEVSVFMREPFLHIAFWLIYFLYPFLKSIGPANSPFHLYSQLNDLFFGMIVFYGSYFFFFPLGKKWSTMVFLLLFFCATGYLNFSIHNYLFGGTHTASYWTYSLSYISTYIILSLFAFVLFAIKDTYKTQQALEEAGRKEQEAKLSGLKAQINPHFLFNTLNTIYSSALKKDDKTPEMILKLSDNFRYILQQTQKERVPLKKEIAHIKDYISLQQIRLASKIAVDLNIELDDDEQLIAPLLIISFLENAFKYTSLLKGSGHPIKIRVTLKNRQFYFYCENPFSKKSAEDIDKNWEQSGIGISNTKKRLQFLYPEKHKLNIDDTQNIFRVTLQLQL
ncbi:GHKL domain-containing protein [Leptobacterium flavescens]|uniref:GHKL domain-containing protein n=1 Tax=Leptobacterium flavescens TaxID=472055 RepID=A0A6P0UT73_9FLAO|nr:histidine kinase [Leptobacterium flavescens]NER15029.1 GHKL domain-containing protein [Leptobacterium flavescens]